MIGSKLELSDITFEIDCLPECMPIKGNASAIDDETDAATEKWIKDELEKGNPWAWCTVRIVGTFKGLTAKDYLGGCSYRGLQDFMAESGYYDDMRENVRAELQRQLDDILSDCTPQGRFIKECNNRRFEA